MDGLVFKPSGIGDEKLVIRAGINQNFTFAVAVIHAMWTNDRPSGL